MKRALPAAAVVLVVAGVVLLDEWWFRNKARDGQGASTWWSGPKYEGELRDGKRHGRGVFTAPSGGRYEGEWRDGEIHGQGVFTLPDGESYEGEFRHGKRHGQGVNTLPSGLRYEGGWRGGMHGDGTDACVRRVWPFARMGHGEAATDAVDGRGDAGTFAKRAGDETLVLCVHRALLGVSGSMAGIIRHGRRRCVRRARGCSIGGWRARRRVTGGDR